MHVGFNLTFEGQEDFTIIQYDKNDEYKYEFLVHIIRFVGFSPVIFVCVQTSLRWWL
jgi:hypothetical protein